VKDSSEGTVYSHIVLGSFVGCGLKRGEGDFLEVFCEGVCVCMSIMNNSSIREQRSSQDDMTSIHRDIVTLNLILVVLSN